MAAHDIAVIGASAGGVKALLRLAGALPQDLPVAVFVVVHYPEEAPSTLPHLLSRAGPLVATNPRDGDPIEHGRIYVAAPGSHLQVKEGRVRLTRGPKENHHRPAIDPLFRTAALAYGARVVGVLLSGADGDGTAGLQAVKQRGGVAVVQDPDEASFARMPKSALEYVEVDHCLPLDGIAALLSRLATEARSQEGVEQGGYPMSDDIALEQKMSELDPATLNSDERPGNVSSLTCPDCSGPLYEIREGELSRYRCRVGHAYGSAEDVLEKNRDRLEDTLYFALNKLQENAAIARRLAARAHEAGQEMAAARFEERERESRQHAETLRRVLLGSPLSQEQTSATSDPAGAP
jgi:two-component system, chemotaxis family, protein-glutamate methylesterase/glutaminase